MWMGSGRVVTILVGILSKGYFLGHSSGWRSLFLFIRSWAVDQNFPDFFFCRFCPKLQTSVLIPLI